VSSRDLVVRCFRSAPGLRGPERLYLWYLSEDHRRPGVEVEVECLSAKDPTTLSVVMLSRIAFSASRPSKPDQVVV
jgi:hypothetical protein